MWPSPTVSAKGPPLAEKTFRRLDAPELLADVASGVVCVNGARAVNQRDEKAAA
jgi:hypothetical protein